MCIRDRVRDGPSGKNSGYGQGKVGEFILFFFVRVGTLQKASLQQDPSSCVAVNFDQLILTFELDLDSSCQVARYLGQRSFG